MTFIAVEISTFKSFLNIIYASFTRDYYDKRAHSKENMLYNFIVENPETDDSKFIHRSETFTYFKVIQ